MNAANAAVTATHAPSLGIAVFAPNPQAAQAAQQSVQQLLTALNLAQHVQSQCGLATQLLGEQATTSAMAWVVTWVLRADCITAWMPGLDTLGLCQRMGLQPHSQADDLTREIWLTLLASPLTQAFPSVDELTSAVRMRQFIVNAARRTALDFHTQQAERPEDCWTYHEDTGFTVRPGSALIDALIKATQPEASGTLYAFSCYRATEYILLLAIAQEASISNPSLLAALQTQWETRAIMSGRFHEVFLHETGSMEAPLPISYYIPGDRIWFRNPDDASSDVAGFEGSWVFYIGNGQFPNFWQRDKPFTLTTKCLDVYHWRHGTQRDAAGELQMDEALVDRLVDASLLDPQQVREVFDRMYRLRDPKGVYASGGCMDTTREAPRWIRPHTTDIVLPGMY